MSTVFRFVSVTMVAATVIAPGRRRQRRHRGALVTVAFLFLVLVSLTAGAQNLVQVESQFQVNDYTSGQQENVAVGSDGAGGFVVVWVSGASSVGEDDGYSIQGQRYSSDGSAVASQFHVNSFTPSYQNYPSVGPDGAGGFVVVWHSSGSYGDDDDQTSIQGQRYASDGSMAGGEFQVNVSTTNFQSYPAVGPDGAGGFVVIWESDDRTGGDNDQTSIEGQRYSSDGSTAGGEFQTNTYTTGRQYSPSVSSDGAGGFVVVWTSLGSGGNDNDVFSVQGQRYASDGLPAGGEFQVNTYTSSSQVNADVGPDGAGGFVVVWQSLGSSGTDTDVNSIQGQRFTADGLVAGGEFQVNTYTTVNQRSSRVGSDGAGGFVVIWGSTGSSGGDVDGSSIQGQRYASDGSKIGSESQVNTYTTSFQSDPGLALDGAGGFVVSWRSSGSGGTDTDFTSIQGQRYRPALFVDGFETGDTSGWSAGRGGPVR